ncbi:2212_t:CDS:1, partial [Dentiscutata heterogama]
MPINCKIPKMNNSCEVISSPEGINKINIRGYLMNQERNYYWCYEKQMQRS